MSGPTKKPRAKVDAEAPRAKVDAEAALRDMSPARRALFDRLLPLVEAVAKYEVPRLKHQVAEEDLRQEGLIGLAKACATFDPEIAQRTGRTPEQWAKPHIRWAMRKAVRAEVRRQKRELRAAQEEGALQVAYGARAAHPFHDDDDSVKGLLAGATDAALGGAVACLAGSVLRAPGEEGVLLRLEYAALLAAMGEERAKRAKVEPFGEWVYARKYDDELTWEEIEAIANGATRKQIRYALFLMLQALGEALRGRGFEGTPQS